MHMQDKEVREVDYGEHSSLMSRSVRLAQAQTLKESMRRGTPTSAILGYFGAVLRHRPEALPLYELTKLYKLSSMCPRYDYFISHSWRANGTKKYVTLMLSLLGRRSLIIGAIGALFVFVIEYYYDYPFGYVTKVSALKGEGQARISVWLFVVGEVLLFLGLFKGHHLCRERFFLDCTCITQTDEQLKQQSIRMLSGYVGLSDSMIVLWDPTYFDRLWCVYELAAINHFSPEAPIHVLPSSMALFALLIHVFLVPLCVSYLIGMWWLGMPGGQAYTIAQIRFVWRIPFYVIVSRFGQSLRDAQHELRAHLATFDVRRAQCSLDADRKAILRAIDQRMFAGGLDEFNALVRTKLTDVVNASLHSQRAMLPYVVVLFIVLPFGFVKLATVRMLTDVPKFDDGAPWVLVITLAFVSFTIIFLNIPLGIALTLYLAPRRRGLSLDWAKHLIVSCVVSIANTSYNELVTHLSLRFVMDGLEGTCDHEEQLSRQWNPLMLPDSVVRVMSCVSDGQGGMRPVTPLVGLFVAVAFFILTALVTWVVYGPCNSLRNSKAAQFVSRGERPHQQ